MSDSRGMGFWLPAALLLAAIGPVTIAMVAVPWTSHDEATVLAARDGTSPLPATHLLTAAAWRHAVAWVGPKAPVVVLRLPALILAVLLAVLVGLTQRLSIARPGIPWKGALLALASPPVALAVVRLEGFAPLLATVLAVTAGLLLERAVRGRLILTLPAAALAVLAVSSHPVGAGVPLIVLGILLQRHQARTAVAWSAPAWALVFAWPLLFERVFRPGSFATFLPDEFFARFRPETGFLTDSLLLLGFASVVVLAVGRHRAGSWFGWLAVALGGYLPYLVVGGPEGLGRSPIVFGGVAAVSVGLAGSGARLPAVRWSVVFVLMLLGSAFALLGVRNGAERRALAMRAAKAHGDTLKSGSQVLIVAPMNEPWPGPRDAFDRDFKAAFTLHYGQLPFRVIQVPPPTSFAVTPGTLAALGVHLQNDIVLAFDHDSGSFEVSSDLSARSAPDRTDSDQGYELRFRFDDPYQAHAWTDLPKELTMVTTPRYRGETEDGLARYAMDGPMDSAFLSPPLPAVPTAVRFYGRQVSGPAGGHVVLVAGGRMIPIAPFRFDEKEGEVRVPLTPAPSGSVLSPRLLYVPAPKGSEIGLRAIALDFPR